MRIVVIGCGSIGKRHIANLKRIGIRDIVACDLDRERLVYVKRKFRVRDLYTDYKKALRDHPLTAAGFISTPGSSHIPIATFLAQRGVHLFIEKPLSCDLAGVERLLALVKKKRLVTMMGMCYRFHPGLKVIKNLLEKEHLGRVYAARCCGGHYLPDWHPDEDYRKTPYAQKAQGGGVVLTSIHGYDYIRWLFGDPKEVFGVTGRISDLRIDVEDIALAFCKTGRNILVSSHSDFLAREREHRIDVICERGTIRWDYNVNEVRIFMALEKRWKIVKFRFMPNDMYLDEICHFFRRVRQKRPDSAVDIREGLKTLIFALSVKSSARLKKIVML